MLVGESKLDMLTKAAAAEPPLPMPTLSHAATGGANNSLLAGMSGNSGVRPYIDRHLPSYPASLHLHHSMNTVSSSSPLALSVGGSASPSSALPLPPMGTLQLRPSMSVPSVSSNNSFPGAGSGVSGGNINSAALKMANQAMKLSAPSSDWRVYLSIEERKNIRSGIQSAYKRKAPSYEELLSVCSAIEEELLFRNAASRLEYLKMGIQFEKRIVLKQQEFAGDRLSLILPTTVVDPAEGSPVAAPSSSASPSTGAAASVSAPQTITPFATASAPTKTSGSNSAEASEDDQNVLDSSDLGNMVGPSEFKLPLKRARSDPGSSSQ